MRIWIDADACPKMAKEVVFRLSARLSQVVMMVADRPLPRPQGSKVYTIEVPRDLDSADKYIAQNMAEGDVVITADIPLAAEVVGNGGTGISPRGEVFDAESVGQKLSLRDFHMDLRDAGEELSGPPPYTVKDKEAFAAALDRTMARKA